MYEKLELLINGKWRQGSGGKRNCLQSGNSEVLGELPHASIADLDEALAASEKAFQVWRKETALNRQKIQEKACRILEDRFDEVAENLTKEMGKPLAEAKIELSVAIDIIRWYGEEGNGFTGALCHHVCRALADCQKDPVGPVIAFVA